MNFLFDIPVWLGLLIISIIITFAGLLVVTLVRKKIENKLTKEHEKVGRTLFRVTAGLIALLVSLSYANERIQQYKLIDSIENEATLIINVVIKLNIYNSKESDIIKEKLTDYINYTINDDWKHVNTNPFFSSGANSMKEIMELVYKLTAVDKNQQKLKEDIINEINEVSKLMQIRVFSKQTLTPILIYILGIGLAFIWVFFSVYKPNTISLVFLSLYNIYIAVLIYFIFMLSNPLVGNLKIEPHSYNVLKTKGFDSKFK